MKILHLLKSAPEETVLKIIETHRTGNDVKVIDLSKEEIVYDTLVDCIFDCDRVFSW